MIVQLEITHIPKILHAQKELYSMNFRNMVFNKEFYDMILSWYQVALENQDWKAFVLLVDEEVSGFYLAQYLEGAGYLSQMFVSGKLRGKGYGKVLLNHFEQGLEEPGYYILQASGMNEEAVAFYERNGYEIIRPYEDENGDPRYLMIKYNF
ncbi:GNAT family N-acetyltransferase [Bacillus sp. FJAT-27245]|uniref:GNAT family N-acetyltransferase n=1 Tax=Bacillus sp. FJAT-27245 TaxID=1684144 RepID=UPI0006A78C49|nr:GNAT family N-acetyltransferase [Bacillus sp. FJAT-27245]